ncbi:hypothetical protein B0H12DRAFT_1205561 [Mycena haematopus]|nr:hypothetical protein B0H12DRAFT_1205561 [Mycena haematopus]
MAVSRRGSGSIVLFLGQTMARMKGYEKKFLGLVKPRPTVPMILAFGSRWRTAQETGVILAVGRISPPAIPAKPMSPGGSLSMSRHPGHGQKLFDLWAECPTSVDTNLADGNSGLKFKPEGEATFWIHCEFRSFSRERIDHSVPIRWMKSFGAANTKARTWRPCSASLSQSTSLINNTSTLIASTMSTPGRICSRRRCPKIKNLGIDDKATMGISCERDAFDSFEHEHLSRTKCDAIVDGTEEQAVENFISGRNLGEIIWLVVCELVDEGLLLLRQHTFKLWAVYVFDTTFLSLMASDLTDEPFVITASYALFALGTTLPERLSACGIVAIVSKIQYSAEECAAGAGADGNTPGCADRGHEWLVDVLGEKGRNVVTHHAETVAATTRIRKDAALFVNV